MSEVRHFFRTNDVPIYFVGATPFNLLGLDRWVRNLSYVAYYDAWDGAHPRVFTPKDKPYVEFSSGEDINNWLLANPEVRAQMSRGLRPGVRPKIAMVFFNEETEAICEELGYDRRSRRTCPPWGRAATPGPPCATCSTCARASTSPRTTSTRTPRCGCSSRPSAGPPSVARACRRRCTTTC
jgi:hypothetical protein